jgi:uncharacterized protein
MATRREILLGGAGLALTAGLARAAASPALMSAARLGDHDGGVIWRAQALTPFALPARGHALAHAESGHVALIGRRPGLFGTLVDPRDGSTRVFAASRDARFAGHAACDGTRLVTGEFDAATFEAALVVRDAATGVEQARWRPGGIEPHELVFAGDRLIVALGGLIEDGGVAGPADNPGGIKSEVLEIDPKSGRVLARHALPPAFGSLSLRHLAPLPDGETVAVAAQDQDLSQTRPLVALLRLGKGIEPLATPDPRDIDFRGYIGSIAADRSGAYLAAASPRASLLGLWSAGSGAFLAALPIADVCGVTAGIEPGIFWASSGHGGVYRIDAAAAKIAAEWHVDAGFDNHLLMV